MSTGRKWGRLGNRTTESLRGTERTERLIFNFGPGRPGLSGSYTPVSVHPPLSLLQAVGIPAQIIVKRRVEGFLQIDPLTFSYTSSSLWAKRSTNHSATAALHLHCPGVLQENTPSSESTIAIILGSVRYLRQVPAWTPSSSATNGRCRHTDVGPTATRTKSPPTRKDPNGSPYLWETAIALELRSMDLPGGAPERPWPGPQHERSRSRAA